MPLTAEEKKMRKKEKKAQEVRDAEERRLKRRKDELSREVAMSLGARMVHGKRWYGESYRSQWPLVRQDMEAARCAAEHVLDTKDFIIAHLADTMDEVNFQKAMSWQDFVIKMDERILEYMRKIESMDNDFNQKLQITLDKASDESIMQKVNQNDLEAYYKTILFIIEEKFQETTIAEQGEYMTKRDEESKKGTHDLEAMSGELENSLQATVTAIKDILQEYTDTTETRRKEMKTLMEKDSYYTDMIMRQDVKMSRLSEALSSLQAQASEKHEWRLLLDDLKKDKEETYTEYTLVRAELTRESDLDHEKLLTLTGESNNVLESLQSVVTKGEKILRMGALCRRLETQEEKVLSFVDQSSTKDDSKESNIHSPFSTFWRRCAHASLMKRQMEPTLCALRKENQELTESLETTLEILAMTRS